MDTIHNFSGYQRINNNAHVDRSMQMVFTLIWVGYLLLSPFYIFKSGLPQPSDLLILFGLAPALATSILNYRGGVTNTYMFGTLFVILTAIINTLYYVHLGDKIFIIPATLYIFDFLVFCFIVNLFKHSPSLLNQVTYIAVVMMIIMEFCYLVFVDTSIGRRHIGTFNNPNQLGHWALIIGATLVALKRAKSINWFDLGLLAMIGYIQTKTLSKAGMISFALLMGVIVIQKHTSKKIKYVILLAFSLLLILEVTSPKTLLNVASQVSNVDKVVKRLMALGEEKDDNLLVRGYARLVEHPEYMILGAGEGAYWRFSSRHELHASLAAILFSYGVLGFFLFISFLYFIFRRLPMQYTLLLIPIMVHGLVHQNVRNTVFWVFLAVVYSAQYFHKSEREQIQKA